MRAFSLGRSKLGTIKTKETGYAFLMPGFIGVGIYFKSPRPSFSGSLNPKTLRTLGPPSVA
jgi:hypothetical protein